MEPVGAATQAQATHEAEIQGLREEIAARADSERSLLVWNDELARERDEARAAFERVAADGNELRTLREDIRSLERSFARAIDNVARLETAAGQAERARDDARAECQKLLDENRALKQALRDGECSQCDSLKADAAELRARRLADEERRIDD